MGSPAWREGQVGCLISGSTGSELLGRSEAEAFGWDNYCSCTRWASKRPKPGTLKTFRASPSPGPGLGPRLRSLGSGLAPWEPEFGLEVAL